MKLRMKILLVLTVVAAAIGTLLFVNRERLSASAGVVSAKPSVVTVVAARTRPVPLDFSGVGVLKAVNDVPVIVETQGRVIKRYVDVGMHVHAGQPMFKVDTLLKYAAFTSAFATYAKAKSDLARFGVLREQGNLSSNDLELAELNCKSAEAEYLVAKRQYEDATIRAPIAGVVADRSLDVGMMVMPGIPIATIVDISRLKLTASVPENVVIRMRRGGSVSLAVDALPGTVFPGRISFIGPKAGEALLFPVEVVVANTPGCTLKAGMTGRARFYDSSATAVLVIPRLALIGSAREGVVYVLEESRIHRRTITVGGEHDGVVEVIAGLKDGERVVTIGKNTIRDGAVVEAIGETE